MIDLGGSFRLGSRGWEIFIADATGRRARERSIGKKKSIRRLENFTAGKLIAHVLGNHIEQTNTPFIDYKVGTGYQPQEHQLQLTRGHILELRQALEGMHGAPVRYAAADFTIWPKD